MIEDIVGNNGTRFIIAAGAVALGLLCLVAILWFIRNRPSSPFIRGGKNRQPRLAVLDAAAVDTRRRLVLVRRDDVEHLILIGGPTDVVIESRIVSQAASQPATVPSLQETTAARPVAERRVAPQPDTRNPPVSAVSQVLYGESADLSPAPAVRAAQPAQARPQTETMPLARQTPERALSVQPQPRAQPTAYNATAAAIRTADSPEDILDVARTRVLAANTPAPAQRPLTQTPPASDLAATQSAIPISDSQKDIAAIEFERILDAQITGDLGRLTADDVRVDAVQRENASSTNPAVRQEPRLGSGASGRTEPTLEDEMNRMLNEIAVNRKN